MSQERSGYNLLISRRGERGALEDWLTILWTEPEWEGCLQHVAGCLAIDRVGRERVEAAAREARAIAGKKPV